MSSRTQSGMCSSVAWLLQWNSSTACHMTPNFVHTPCHHHGCDSLRCCKPAPSCSQFIAALASHLVGIIHITPLLALCARLPLAPCHISCSSAHPHAMHAHSRRELRRIVPIAIRAQQLCHRSVIWPRVRRIRPHPRHRRVHPRRIKISHPHCLRICGLQNRRLQAAPLPERHFRALRRHRQPRGVAPLARSPVPRGVLAGTLRDVGRGVAAAIGAAARQRGVGLHPPVVTRADMTV